MKHFLTPLLAILFASSVNAETAWEKYVSLPSPSNAEVTNSIEYSAETPGDEWGYEYQHIRLLESQVIAGDLAAFRLAYRARESADGALLEYLSKVSSRLIRVDAAAFLGEVQKLEMPERTLETILLTVGEEYVDLYEARQYEIRSRLSAISEVDDKRLQEIRARCLKILDNAV